MKTKSKLFFTDTKKIIRKYPENKKRIQKESKNLHIFFCEGLILTKKINNKIKINFLSKENPLMTYVDLTVYLGKSKSKSLYVHNLSLNKIAKGKFNQIEFFKNILKQEKLFNSTFSDLRITFAGLSLKDSSIAGLAKSLVNWKLENKFCTKCGIKFESFTNDHWEIKCEHCNKVYFPRIDPVIIVIIIKNNETLIGRSHHFPVKLYSCLAGFVELGETLENAAMREIKEEVGLNIYDIKFITNQPWPFPSSLMIGLSAKTKDRKLIIDNNEIEDAFWVSKEDLKLVLNGKADNFIPARKGTIARYLLEKWVNDEM